MLQAFCLHTNATHDINRSVHFLAQAELTVQLSAKSGAGVLSLNVSLNTAEQNSSWDSCSLVDTMPSLHTAKSKPVGNHRQGEGQYVEETKARVRVDSEIVESCYCFEAKNIARRKRNAGRSWADNMPSLHITNQKSA